MQGKLHCLVGFPFYTQTRLQTEKFKTFFSKVYVCGFKDKLSYFVKNVKILLIFEP